MSTWTCSETGLSLIRQSVTMFRVSSSKPDRGPLNPRGMKEANPVDRAGWSRFDLGPAAPPPPDLGYTIYGASRKDTAFVEVLGWKAATSKTFAGLYEEASFTGTPIDKVLADLRVMGAPIGQVTEKWRKERAIFTLKTQDEIWIDPTDRVNLSIVAGMTGGSFGAHRRLTTADITGDDRTFTTFVAETLRNLDISDEHGNLSKIFGIRYQSKFGAADEDDYCWTAWLNAPNTGANIINNQPMDPNDPDVKTASRITGVHVP